MEDYVCKLDDFTLKVAKDELYEDPKNRQGAIDTFREWIQQQKHMKCPMDNVFLLGFLRAKHFSQLEAREALERFMNLRETHPDWLKNIDTMDKDIVAAIKLDTMTMLPQRDPDGRRIAIMRRGTMKKPDKNTMLTFGRIMCLFGYYHYLTDEMTQVHGTVNLQDMTGHTMARELAIPLEWKKKLTTIMQKAFPSRLKAFHLYNPGAMMEFFMTLISALLTDKLKKRLHFHNHGLESLYKYIPMECLPEDYVPDEFEGSKQGTMKEVIEWTLSVIQDPEIRARIKHLSSDEFYIKMNEKDTDVPTASFRKLNVD